MQHHTEEAWKGAIQELTSMGIERILSSGGKPTAIEGADNLKKLVEWSENKIQIMPGSGINSENVVSILKITKATEIHATAKKLMTYQPVGSSSYHQADLLEIQKIKAAISAI
jgi:copper homeostasis protein CutC